MLFAELCIRQARPGGRIGIILPNGYLGNSSMRYLAFREWMLRHTRLVAVIGFPRFTFKKSGADVSASVVVLEKRDEPLAHSSKSERYPFYAGLLESVGWSVGDKGGERVFKRDPENGSYLLDEANDRIIDADFDRVLKEFLSSKPAEVFPWIADGRSAGTGGWSVNIGNVLARADLSIDPKRWCERVSLVRKKIKKVDHFALRDILDVIPVVGIPKEKSNIYQYVDIEATADGVAMPSSMRGWQLPDRARHRAQAGDIYVGKVWSSVGKWFVAGQQCDDWIVTNGFHRMRLKEGMNDLLLDLIAALNTDGLADLSEENLVDIVLPRVTNPTTRATLQPMVDALLAGRSTVANLVGELLAKGDLPVIDVVPRSSHVVQV